MAPNDPYKPNSFDVEQPILTGEHGKLSGQFGGGTEPPAITDFEAFETWSHEAIWAALETANPEGINATALSWRGIYNTGNAALPDFLAKMSSAINANWQGASGEAAAAAIGEYTKQADQLLKSMLLVANDLDQTEAVLLETRARVGEPMAVSSASNAGIQEGIVEAEAEARRVMRTFYQPGVSEIDARTPRLPEPQSVAGAPSGGAAGTSSGSPGGSAGGASDEATRAASMGSSPSASSPAAATGQSTSTGQSPNAGSSGAAGGGGATGPSSGGATAAGLAGGAAGALAAAPRSSGPLAKSVPSSPAVGGGTGAPSANRSSTAPIGGMYPPVGRGRGEDEENRDPSAYLVAASNTNELVGELPLTTQPVIGE